MTIVLFEDNRVDALRPITFTRSACLISVAGFTLYEAIKHFHAKADVRILTHPHLKKTTLQQLPDSDPKGVKGEVLLVNARLVPHLSSLKKLHEKAHAGTPIVANGELVAMHATVKNLDDVEKILTDRHATTLQTDVPLLNYPWDPVKYNLEFAKENLTALSQEKGYSEIQPGVFAKPSTVVKEFVSFNTETGSIILDENVTIGNFVAMRGPIRVRKNSMILEHSVIVGPTTIGETCKLRGEVMESIIESYSNKQHYGHIGHAYIGSWVNIGAGTTNSDLKNTYGTVKVTMSEKQRIDTDMQFLGCILGDHVKTAINTTIMTGMIAGTGAHLAGTISANVPAFVSTYKNNLIEIPQSLSEKIAKRAMKRRDVKMTKADSALLQYAYEESEKERKETLNEKTSSRGTSFRSDPNCRAPYGRLQ